MWKHSSWVDTFLHLFYRPSILKILFIEFRSCSDWCPTWGSRVSANDKRSGLSLSPHSQLARNIIFISYFSTELNFNFEIPFCWVVETQSLWSYTPVFSVLSPRFTGLIKMPRHGGGRNRGRIWHRLSSVSPGIFKDSFSSDLELSISTEYIWVFIFPDNKILSSFPHELVENCFQNQAEQKL